MTKGHWIRFCQVVLLFLGISLAVKLYSQKNEIELPQSELWFTQSLYARDGEMAQKFIVGDNETCQHMHLILR